MGGWGLRWWDTGSDPVTLPAAPGVELQSGGRGILPANLNLEALTHKQHMHASSTLSGIRDGEGIDFDKYKRRSFKALQKGSFS